MITTKDLLKRLIVEFKLDSDRQVAKLLDISHTSVQNWRKGGVMSDDIVCEVAYMLGLDVDLTLLAIIAERSKNDRVVEAIERVTNQKKTA
ncbi:helix-turn-helix domain-containing protein [Vibrio coralliilyticus]|uniref:helix-turn-helix domain-containing protein n=1 Tax=Vibrio coralliilyticus TaxID=190893 RepID=UPI001E3949B1|nr:helix-turn-helix domain-containing protein [Vibrio coralliilyticus]MCC2524121.1 helix-turn-helix domain containing protein [Vibrio coralliilyticus]